MDYRSLSLLGVIDLVRTHKGEGKGVDQKLTPCVQGEGDHTCKYVRKMSLVCT